MTLPELYTVFKAKQGYQSITQFQKYFLSFPSCQWVILSFFLFVFIFFPEFCGIFLWSNICLMYSLFFSHMFITWCAHSKQATISPPEVIQLQKRRKCSHTVRLHGIPTPTCTYTPLCCTFVLLFDLPVNQSIPWYSSLISYCHCPGIRSVALFEIFFLLGRNGLCTALKTLPCFVLFWFYVRLSHSVVIEHLSSLN